MTPDIPPLPHQTMPSTQPKLAKAGPGSVVCPKPNQAAAAAGEGGAPSLQRTLSAAIRYTGSWDLFNPSTEDFVLLDPATPCF